MSLFRHNPHSKCRITSSFGYRTHPVTHVKTMHKGIDIGALVAGKEGDPLFAVADGKVEICKVNGGGAKCGYGYYIQINHGSFKTLYGHLQKLPALKVGQAVKTGQQIGIMGNTGTSTAAHCHFGLFKGGAWIDPAPYLLSLTQAKEENEVVEKVQMLVNGKKQTVDRILKDGSNFVKISQLDELDVCAVSYDSATKLVTISKVK